MNTRSGIAPTENGVLFVVAIVNNNGGRHGEGVMFIFAIVNNKGGVGKTTTTINLAAALSRMGFQVLVVDLDPQANTSMTLTPIPIDFYSLKANIVTFLKGETFDDSWFLAVDDIHLIPGHIDLEAYVMQLQTNYTAPLLLQQRLQALPLAQMDFVLIDTPPNLGLLTANALVAATHYIVPLESGGKYSMNGYVGLERLITNIRPLNPNLALLGALLQRHDGRRIECRRSLDAAHVRLPPGGVFHTTISTSAAKVQASQTQRRTLFQVDRASAPTLDYGRLAKEILDRLKITPRREIADVPTIAAS